MFGMSTHDLCNINFLVIWGRSTMFNFIPIKRSQLVSKFKNFNDFFKSGPNNTLILVASVASDKAVYLGEIQPSNN